MIIYRKAVGYDKILNEQIKAAGSLQCVVNIISRLFNSLTPA